MPDSEGPSTGTPTEVHTSEPSQVEVPAGITAGGITRAPEATAAETVGAVNATHVGVELQDPKVASIEAPADSLVKVGEQAGDAHEGSAHDRAMDIELRQLLDAADMKARLTEAASQHGFDSSLLDSNPAFVEALQGVLNVEGEMADANTNRDDSRRALSASEERIVRLQVLLTDRLRGLEGFRSTEGAKDASGTISAPEVSGEPAPDTTPASDKVLEPA